MGDYFGRDVKVMDLRGIKSDAYLARARVSSARSRAVAQLTSLSPASKARPATATVGGGAGGGRPVVGGVDAAATSAAVIGNLSARLASVEAALTALSEDFSTHLLNNTAPRHSQFYAVSFGPGAMGMNLMATEGGSIAVAELRDDAYGAPLLAKESGQVAVGDEVIAINHHVLHR